MNTDSVPARMAELNRAIESLKECYLAQPSCSFAVKLHAELVTEMVRLSNLRFDAPASSSPTPAPLAQ